MSRPSLFAILLFSSIAHGLNDWSKPCLQGECAYDLASTDGAVSGTLKIWGSPDAISDITPAAGWTILGCDSDAIAQDIRLVCQTDDTSSGCNHLLQNSGAEGKIVRLPENCGKSAFARVARSWIHEDQSIPSDIAARLVRRADAQPQVRGLTLDTDFSKVDPAKSGNVSIAIQGATVPGANGNLTITPPTAPKRRSRLARRGVFGFIEDAFNKFNTFDENLTKALPPVDVNKDFPLFEQKVSCGPVDASVAADINTKAHAVVTVGVAATGTIVPPKLDDFGLFASLDADLDGSLTLTGSASGSIDSGARSLFEVGIPGLDFPGILSVGPTFKILGQAKASLDINVDMTVDLSYKVNGAKLFFPASKENPSGGGFTPGDTPLKLSVSPSLASKGTVEAHLIPTLDFGINALGGVAQATVSLNLDASAQMILSLDAQADASVTLAPNNARVNAVNINAPAATSATPSADDAATESATPTLAVDDSSTGATGSDGTAAGIASANSADASATDGEFDVDASDVNNGGFGDDTADESNSSVEDNSNFGAADDNSDFSGTSNDVGATDDDSDFGASGDNSDFGTTNDSSDFDGSSAGSNSFDPGFDQSGSDGFDDSASDFGETGSGFAVPDDSGSDFGGDDAGADDGFGFARRSTRRMRRAQVTTSAGASVNGCVDVGAALNVNAGADGSFFGIFDKSTKVNLFSKNFELFKKCLGTSTGAANQRRRLIHSSTFSRRFGGAGALESRALSCSAANAATSLASVVDTVLPASSIKRSLL